MASNTVKRPLRNIANSNTCPCLYRSCAKIIQTLPSSFRARNASTSTTVSHDEVINSRPQQRWAETPRGMVAPVRSRSKSLLNEFEVNEDPVRLEQAYDKILGPRGAQMLTEEVRWLAVTHKSFDHGRRGFNDRLAFLVPIGKRMVDLQASLAIIQSPISSPDSTMSSPSEDEYGRIPFRHSALEGLENLTQESTGQITEKVRMSQLAMRYGLGGVVRWKPRKADNLQGSGSDVVLSSALYAIIGAVALQKGGEAANKVIRERILSPLGAV
ncbi:MAG: hypothetical protein M1827_000151 [Pycnora praestabilis]|nr:MAG: hypothetical protein M1827_000151 [Pycnora praestabilis]